METMTTRNPRWREFAKQLAVIMNQCRGGHDKTGAISIMLGMGNIDIKESCLYFHKRGGHCDCEIIYNIDRGNKWQTPS